jgi:hypothetical protein
MRTKGLEEPWTIEAGQECFLLYDDEQSAWNVFLAFELEQSDKMVNV